MVDAWSANDPTSSRSIDSVEQLRRIATKRGSVLDPDTTLDSRALLAEATSRTGGLTDLGDGPFLEPLDRLVDSANAEARLNEIGHLIASERILGHTVNRLNYVNDRKRFPEIERQRIERPVFIIGLPRTGTTILHDILASDPANRAPLTWEVQYPSPPPRTETYDSDPRIAECQAMFPPVDDDDPGFAAIHPMGAELAQECIVFWGEAMCTPLFHNQFRVPAYQDWVDHEADYGAVYDLHQRQLQHLQSQHHADRWVLKSGGHMWGLEHLLATYPDAQIVFTHRDPVESATSFASLTTFVRSMGSDHIDQVEIASDWTPRLVHAVSHALEVRDTGEYPDATFHDVRFDDFVTDQFAVVEEIYDMFDIAMTERAEASMRKFIDDNPKGKHGQHDYSPEEYGVDPTAVRTEFSSYIERFDLLPK